MVSDRWWGRRQKGDELCSDFSSVGLMWWGIFFVRHRAISLSWNRAVTNKGKAELTLWVCLVPQRLGTFLDFLESGNQVIQELKARRETKVLQSWAHTGEPWSPCHTKWRGGEQRRKWKIHLELSVENIRGLEIQAYVACGYDRNIPTWLELFRTEKLIWKLEKVQINQGIPA